MQIPSRKKMTQKRALKEVPVCFTATLSCKNPSSCKLSLLGPGQGQVKSGTIKRKNNMILVNRKTFSETSVILDLRWFKKRKLQDKSMILVCMILVPGIEDMKLEYETSGPEGRAKQLDTLLSHFLKWFIRAASADARKRSDSDDALRENILARRTVLKILRKLFCVINPNDANDDGHDHSENRHNMLDSEFSNFPTEVS
ncbi:hypothetical protein P885DRAFT_57020 [Corynascus similis CBS 632.67]